MYDWLIHRKFDDGDRVRAIGPLAEMYPRMIGIVRSVTLVSKVYKYSVQFEDGRSKTFFGFELQRANLVAPNS